MDRVALCDSLAHKGMGPARIVKCQGMVLLDAVISGNAGQDIFSAPAEPGNEMVQDPAENDDVIRFHRFFCHGQTGAPEGVSDVYQPGGVKAGGIADAHPADTGLACQKSEPGFRDRGMGAQGDDHRDLFIRYAHVCQGLDDGGHKQVSSGPQPGVIRDDDRHFLGGNVRRGCVPDPFLNDGGGLVQGKGWHFFSLDHRQEVFIGEVHCHVGAAFFQIYFHAPSPLLIRVTG